VSGDPQLEELLTLQERDTTLDRLRHRHETLAERDAVARGDVRAAQLDAAVVEVRAQRDELSRQEQKLDDEARSLAAKATEVDQKMYSGEISSPRELQAMQADVEQLRRHQRQLENHELELMEQREPLEITLGEREAERAQLGRELDALRTALAEAEAVIVGEARREHDARGEIVARLDPALVAEYEKCRARAKGVGAARLVGTTCQGCHLSIPATEAEQIKKATAGRLEHCDNCGAILVAQ
jgi:uncharacterized protein